MVQTNLEVGYGMAKGKDALAVGKKAARQALEAIKEHPLSLVLVFASPHYDPEALLRGIRQEVGPAPLIGASAAGEICNGVQRRAVVVLALASPYLQVKVAVGRGVSQDWEMAVIEAVTAPEIAPYFSGPENVMGALLSRQGESAFALLFSPGATPTADSRSFQIMETLERLSQGRLPIMGGNAADGWRLEGNYVFSGAGIYHDSILVAVVETSLTFGISLAHGFRPTSPRATVTLARGLEVLELDGRPAADVYCRMLELPREALAGKHPALTTGRPLGILDPYGQDSINLATCFTDSGGVRFTQPAPEGACLTLMPAAHDDPVAAGGEALHQALRRGSIMDPGLALVFSCALSSRTLGSRLREEISGMMDLAPQVPIMGFCSCAGQGLADDGVNRRHNEVIAVLALGHDLSPAAQMALENESLHAALRRQDIAVEIDKRLARAVARPLQVKEKLEESEAFKSLIYTAPIGIFIIQDGQFKLVNPAVGKVTGHDKDDLLGHDSLTYVPEEYKETLRSQVIQMLKGERTAPCEFQIVTKGGERRWVLETVTPIQYQGRKAILGFFIDVHERVKLEEQLLQSQKMEVVGRLAGGVAHDFNNILTAIMGYNEIVMMSFREEDPIFRHLEGIRKSAERAAALTRQLLAFSRKQLLQPRVTNLNTVITNLEAMLRRLIGEDINLVILLDQALKAVKADPAQFEQVIMNLVINARDAMPMGGKIIVQTANVYLNETFTRRHPELQPGPYIQVSVIDHGLGMDPETLAHIFDPFFTAKASGKGTGLGLSTVYGIIKQSGGHIEVSSQPEEGTVFEIYLPQIEDSPEDSSEQCVSGVTPQGSETVLVVEDEEVLLKLIQEALEMQGYHVLTARNATEALELVKGHAAPIHLLLTDVVMPHKNGRELAELLSPLHPEMKILFMSGYTEDSMVIRGLLNAALPFIQKPFPPMDLLCKVREMIDGPRS
ncbi:MAG: FIST N-terminal domain-containing protein [Desulfobaccales bacterium]|jgi:PAS domain S-box-containing protein